MPPELVPHKTFQGDRVSMQLLLPELSPLSLGHLLGTDIYYQFNVQLKWLRWRKHTRTTTQGSFFPCSLCGCHIFA